MGWRIRKHDWRICDDFVSPQSLHINLDKIHAQQTEVKIENDSTSKDHGGREPHIELEKKKEREREEGGGRGVWIRTECYHKEKQDGPNSRIHPSGWRENQICREKRSCNRWNRSKAYHAKIGFDRKETWNQILFYEKIRRRKVEKRDKEKMRRVTRIQSK